jgi:uncharacterized protein YraI
LRQGRKTGLKYDVVIAETPLNKELYKMKRLISIFALLTVLMMLVVPAAFAQSTTITLNGEAVNVRSGPGLEYTIRATFKSGELTADGRNDFATGMVCEGDASDLNMWLRVDYRGVEGWVNRCAVAIEGNVDALPVVTATAPVLVENSNSEDVVEVVEDFGPQPSGRFVTAYTLARVNFREEANVRSNIKEVLAPEQGVYATGRTANNQWIEVSFGGETGWVARYLVLMPANWETTLPVK